MAPSSEQTTDPKARPKNAKEKVHAENMMANRHQKTQEAMKNNSEGMEMRKRLCVFRLYKDKFSDENSGNQGVNGLGRIKEIIKDVYPERRKAGGDMKLDTVAKVLQTIIDLGWMTKDSEERKELKSDNDLTPENNEDDSPALAETIPRPAQPSRKPAVVDQPSSTVDKNDRGDYGRMKTIPVHLASGLQSKVLKSAQNMLEESCHKFFKRPGALYLLKRRKWEEKEDTELNLYGLIIFQHPAVRADPKLKAELTACFQRVPYLRHAAVHRDLQISILIVEAMLNDALRLLRAIGAYKATIVLKRWYEEVKRLRQKHEEHAKSSEDLEERNTYTTVTRSKGKGYQQQSWTQGAKYCTQGMPSSAISDTDSVVLAQLMWDHAVSTLGPRPGSLNFSSNEVPSEYNTVDTKPQSILEMVEDSKNWQSEKTSTDTYEDEAELSLEIESNSKQESIDDPVFDSGLDTDINFDAQTEIDTDDGSGAEEDGEIGAKRPAKRQTKDDSEAIFNSLLDQAVQDDIRAAMAAAEETRIVRETERYAIEKESSFIYSAAVDGNSGYQDLVKHDNSVRSATPAPADIDLSSTAQEAVVAEQPSMTQQEVATPISTTPPESIETAQRATFDPTLMDAFIRSRKAATVGVHELEVVYSFKASVEVGGKTTPTAFESVVTAQKDATHDPRLNIFVPSPDKMEEGELSS